ncbi:pteridine transporter-like, putative [Bodo saltans]|uniref:Pteridine transporter-like, putative n=1 Tax=Bodo saltans TaxID=75058 RepID=A0A0S4IKN0_BODSA|nr:pteridine transporter-like, putative [Bodo saltans]|eukprot:CUE67215.1 pteridine transporter-like, putative [Bodo saltans]
MEEEERVDENDAIELETAPLSTLPNPQQATEFKKLRFFRYHVSTQRAFVKFPFFTKVPLLVPLSETFGIYFVCGIGLTYFLNKGITAHTLSSAALPLFKGELGVEASMYQRLVAIGFMAWSMKPLIAIVSDLTTIWGYHKRFLLLCATVASGGLLFLASLLPSSSASSDPGRTALVGGVIFFLANLCCATLDILPEGRYSELIALRPNSGSSVVSWVWSSVMFGGGIAALVQGPLADAGLVRLSLILAGCCQLLLAAPLAKNWLGERVDRLGSAACFSFNQEVLRAHKRLVILSVAMSVGVVISAIAALTLETKSLLMVTSLSAAMLCYGSFYVLPKTAALANTFMFLKELLYIQLPGPMDYFYTADEQCVPGGPHFSYAYYQTFTVIVGYIAGALGVALFHKFFSKRSFRFTFWCTALLKVAASVVDIVIVKRWNRQLGLSDHMSYMLGDAIVFGMCQMLDFMPAVVLMSRLCPKGMESTMYAILAGFSNLGQALSNTTGAFLVDVLWPISASPPCDFSNLPKLLVVGHGLLPLFVIPLSMWMVPDESVSQTDEEVQGGPDADATL